MRTQTFEESRERIYIRDSMFDDTKWFSGIVMNFYSVTTGGVTRCLCIKRFEGVLLSVRRV